MGNGDYNVVVVRCLATGDSLVSKGFVPGRYQGTREWERL